MNKVHFPEENMPENLGRNMPETCQCKTCQITCQKRAINMNENFLGKMSQDFSFLETCQKRATRIVLFFFEFFEVFGAENMPFAPLEMCRAFMFSGMFPGTFGLVYFAPTVRCRAGMFSGMFPGTFDFVYFAPSER